MLVEMERFARSWDRTSPIFEAVAASWAEDKTDLMKREKRKKKRRRRTRRTRWRPSGFLFCCSS